MVAPLAEFNRDRRFRRPVLVGHAVGQRRGTRFRRPDGERFTRSSGQLVASPRNRIAQLDQLPVAESVSKLKRLALLPAAAQAPLLSLF